MTRMSYKTLMRKVDEGYAEVWAWSTSDNVADVIFYRSNGTSTRKMVEVINVPAEHQR